MIEEIHPLYQHSITKFLVALTKENIGSINLAIELRCQSVITVSRTNKEAIPTAATEKLPI